MTTQAPPRPKPPTYRCRDCGYENCEADTWLEPQGRNSHLGPPIPFCRDFEACYRRLTAERQDARRAVAA